MNNEIPSLFQALLDVDIVAYGGILLVYCLSFSSFLLSIYFFRTDTTYDYVSCVELVTPLMKSMIYPPLPIS